MSNKATYIPHCIASVRANQKYLKKIIQQKNTQINFSKIFPCHISFTEPQVTF